MPALLASTWLGRAPWGGHRQRHKGNIWERHRVARIGVCVALYAPTGKSKDAFLVPLPRTSQQIVEQTRDAVLRAIADGKTRMSVDWLLPVGMRKQDFLAINIDMQDATNLRQEYNSAALLASVMLEGMSEGTSRNASSARSQDPLAPSSNIVIARMDDDIESEPVGLVYPEDNSIAALVFPNAESLPMLRQLDDNKGRPLMLINAQWNNSSNLVSDFGIGIWRKRAEDYIKSYQEVYSLSEVRVGNAFNPESSAVMRVFFSYPGGWQVHLLEADPVNGKTMRAELLTILPFKPGYRELAELLKLRRDRGAADKAAYRFAREVAQAPAGASTVPSQAAVLGAPLAVPAPPTEGPRADVPPERLPVFPDGEIATMSARVLRAALTAYGKPTSGKLNALRARLREEQAARRAAAAKEGRAVKPFSQLQVCRVCEGSGRRDCPVCIKTAASANLSCVVCGGWDYVLCAACQGGKLAEVMVQQAASPSAAEEEELDVRRRRLEDLQASLDAREAAVARREGELAAGARAEGAGGGAGRWEGARTAAEAVAAREVALRRRIEEVESSRRSGGGAGAAGGGVRSEGTESSRRSGGGAGAGASGAGAGAGVGSGAKGADGWKSPRWGSSWDEEDEAGALELEELLAAAEGSQVVGGGGTSRWGTVGGPDEEELEAVAAFEREVAAEERARARERGRVGREAGAGAGERRRGIVKDAFAEAAAARRQGGREAAAAARRRKGAGEGAGGGEGRGKSEGGTVKIRAKGRRTGTGRVRTCGICGQPGHDRRSCPEAPKPGT